MANFFQAISNNHYDTELRGMEEHQHIDYANPNDPRNLQDAQRNAKRAKKNKEIDEQKAKKDAIKKMAKFVATHVFMITLVVIYAVAGAFLFKLIESHQEALDCSDGYGSELSAIVNLRTQLVNYVQFNVTTDSSDGDKDNQTTANNNIDEWLYDLANLVTGLKGSNRFVGQDCNSQLKWSSFPQLMLFVTTIMTTIGYGHISPVTTEGRIVALCYATIGIPLFLMCIANLSGVLSDMFRFTYSRVCCYFCLHYNKKKKKEKAAKEALRKQKEQQKKNNGVAPMMNDEKNELEQTPGGLAAIVQANTAENGGAAAQVIDDAENISPNMIEEEEEEEDERVTVPLTVTMLVITVYIMIGAAIFDAFEGWGFVASAYFCYVTLATIGFGDLVPGQSGDINSMTNTIHLFIGSVYALFGIAILAMCFDLMQEEIIAKFVWLGKKVGIIDKDDEEKAEDERRALEKKQKELDEQKEKEKKEMEANGIRYPSAGGAKSAYAGGRRTASPFGQDMRNSPAPAYSETQTTEEERMARIRTAYLKSVNQN